MKRADLDEQTRKTAEAEEARKGRLLERQALVNMKVKLILIKVWVGTYGDF